MRRDEDDENAMDARAYNFEPTPRTYIADAWTDPARRREVLNYLAGEYDWYLDRMISARLRGFGITNDAQIEECIVAVKNRSFLPGNNVIAGDAGQFWLTKWDREKGPLRNFFRTIVRNYITDWLRSEEKKSHFRVSLDNAEWAHPIDGSPSPYHALEQVEFDARYDKKLFIGSAVEMFKDERGADSLAWRVYDAYIRRWPIMKREEVVEFIPELKTLAQVDAYTFKACTRVHELLWWLVRGLELDDISADRALLELVGKLPKCRSKGKRPPHPKRPEKKIEVPFPAPSSRSPSP